MKVTYDAETGVLMVELQGGPVRASEEEKSGVILDYDAKGAWSRSRSWMPRPEATASMRCSCG